MMTAAFGPKQCAHVRAAWSTRASSDSISSPPIRTYSAEIKTLVGVLNFRLSPSTLSGVAPIQSLAPIERSIIFATKQYTKEELMQVARCLADGHETDVVLRRVKFPNPPDHGLLVKIREAILKSGVTDIIIYGVFHQIFAWIACEQRDPEFVALALRIVTFFVHRADATEMDVMLRLLINAVLGDIGLDFSEKIYQAAIAHIAVNTHLTAEFAPTFRAFAIRVLASRLPQRGAFLRACREFVTHPRPWLVVKTFVGLFRVYIELLDRPAIDFICFVGGVETQIGPEVRGCFEILPRALLALVKSGTPVHGFFEPDEAPELALVPPVLECVFLSHSKMVFNSSLVCPADLVETSRVESVRSILPEIFTFSGLTSLPRSLAAVSPQYVDAFFLSFQDLLLDLTHADYYLDLFTIYLYFADELAEIVSLVSYAKGLLSTTIFHRKYSFFGEMPEEIAMFRDVFFNVCMKGSQELCFELLCFAATRSPWLFAEQVMRFLLHLNDFRLEMLCSERVLLALAATSVSLRDLYLSEVTDGCYLARCTCCSLVFGIVADPAAFRLASSSSHFATGCLQLLFEPGIAEFFLVQLRNGFMTCTVAESTPFFLQLIPSLCTVVEVCAQKSDDASFTKLAELLFNCMTTALTNKRLLIHSFIPAFPTLLNYVFTVPHADLMRDCFTFLSIAAQYIPQFHFTSEILRLLIDLIGKVEGSDPSVSTRSNFVALLSGATNQRANSVFLIKHPVFIPLVIVAYRQSPQLVDLIEYFSALCVHASANCLACHEGDLDFLLLEVLAHRDHSFEFLGYLLSFEIQDSVAFTAILSLVSTIMKVKTSTVICDKLIQLTVPGSPSYHPEYAKLVLDRLNRSISADSHRKSPVFDMIAADKQCQVIGLTADMVNSGFTISFWLTIDTPQLLQMSEVFYLFRLVSIETGHAFRVFANNGNLFVSYTDADGTLAGCFFNDIPGHVWTPFTVSVEHEKDYRSVVQFFKVRVGAPPPPFLPILFPPGNVHLLIGGVDHPEHTFTSPGMIGPFAFHAEGSDLGTFLNFPFDADPNFEHFKEATFTSDVVNHPQPNSRFQFEVFHSHYGNTFFETITNDYDLNYLGSMLQVFRNERMQCPPAFLKMILGFLSASTSAQHHFLSVPCLAQMLPSIVTLNYQVYNMFFTFMSGCQDPRLVHEMLDYILLNMEIWMRCDFQSVTRILHHWSSALLATFQTTLLRRWTVKRLLAVFVILFFSDVDTGILCGGNDIGIQVDLLEDVKESASIYSFSVFHTREETLQCRELYQQYIISVGQLGLSVSDVEALYSHLFQAKTRDRLIVFLSLLVHLGNKIANRTDLSFNPIIPLQQFLNRNDPDILSLAILGIYELSGSDVHYLMSVISIQVATTPALKPVFSVLLDGVPEFPNLFSLICCLSLSMGNEEKEAALDRLDMIATDATKRDNIVACGFSWIWPLALGLVVNEDDQERVASFVSLLIAAEPGFLTRFEAVLRTIWLLANDSFTQAHLLASAVTLVVYRDVFSCQDERNRKDMSAFLVLALRTVFFQVSGELCSGPLIAGFHMSPFRESVPRRESSVKTFVNFMQKYLALSDQLPLRFGLRLCVTKEWIDQTLIVMLTSLIGLADATSQLLHDFAQVASYFQNRNRSILDVQKTIDHLYDALGPWDIRSFAKSLRERCERADLIISNGPRGLPARFHPIWATDARNELRRLDDLVVEAKKTKRQIQKDLVFQRNLSLFKRETETQMYHRDNCRCFAFCPIRVKPKFCAGPKSWEFLQGVSVQVNEKSARRSTTDLGDTFPCRLIRPSKLWNGQLWFSPLEVVITFPDHNRSWYLPFREILHIFPRRYYQADTAVELFLRDGTSFFLDFGPVKNTEILLFFETCDCQTLTLSDLTRQWRESKISNFEYLMSLNVLAGRTFDDVTQYPILPNLSSNRDLSVPMRQKPSLVPFDHRNFVMDTLFGESFLTPPTIEQLLFRLDPFTSIFYQHHRRPIVIVVDSNDNLPMSELPPEFYFQPEIFEDLNKLNLPKSSLAKKPMDFVYSQRKLLESDEISISLHKWIDLIFGFRQSGKPSFEVGNMIMPYDGELMEMQKMGGCIFRSPVGNPTYHFRDAQRMRLCPRMKEQHFSLSHFEVWYSRTAELQGVRRPFSVGSVSLVWNMKHIKFDSNWRMKRLSNVGMIRRGLCATDRII
jgi:hypothetical protein